MPPLGAELPQPLVLEDRLLVLPRNGVQACKAGVCLFSGRLFGDYLPERFYGRLELPVLFAEHGQLDEEREVKLPQLFPPTLHPPLVAVTRQ